MSVLTRKGPLFDPGICRCCGSTKRCRLLNVEYECLGHKEVYAEMFVDCFGLMLCNLEGRAEERLVCATCVGRLRDACAFRRQVLAHEQRLLQTHIQTEPIVAIKIEVEEVKEEVSTPPRDPFLNDEPDCIQITETTAPKSTQHTNTAEQDFTRRTRSKNLASTQQIQIKDQSSTHGTQSKDCSSTHTSTQAQVDEHEDAHMYSDGREDPQDTDSEEKLEREAEELLKKAKSAEKKQKKLTKVSAKRKAMLESERAGARAGERPATRASERAGIDLKRMKIKLRELDQLDKYDAPLSPPKPRPVDKNAAKAFANMLTLVSNSYVCPFYTSFSDYYCIYCKTTFTDPDKLRAHTLEHAPDALPQHASRNKIAQVDVTRVDCRLCSAQIPDIETLKRHLTSEHGKFLHPKLSNEFLQFRLTANNLTCTECGATFSFFHALKKHMAEHFGSWICDVCGAHYFEERMLGLHQKSHLKVEQTFGCGECARVFRSAHSRRLHVARQHRREPAYHCQRCDAALHSYSQRYRHMIDVHHEERSFTCDHCDRSYDTRKSLREHVRRYHLKIFKHQCDLCDKRFYLPCRLKEHMATHTGERNYRCEFCGKTYPRLRGLKVHLQSHSPDKKFKCHLCHATFTQNVNLKNHMKRTHQSVLEEGFHE